jgi:hypothetical protein
MNDRRSPHTLSINRKRARLHDLHLHRFFGSAPPHSSSAELMAGPLSPSTVQHECERAAFLNFLSCSRAEIRCWSAEDAVWGGRRSFRALLDLRCVSRCTAGEYPTPGTLLYTIWPSSFPRLYRISLEERNVISRVLSYRCISLFQELTIVWDLCCQSAFSQDCSIFLPGEIFALK